MSFSWKGLWASIKLPVYIVGVTLCMRGLHGHTADLLDGIQQMETARAELEKSLAAPIATVETGTDDVGIL
jgi:hypothetical protein